MAKILVVTSGLTGIYNSSQELMNRLKGMGHEVCSASPNQELDASNSAYPYYKLNPIKLKSIVQIERDLNYRGFKGLFYRNLNRKIRQDEAINLIEPKDFVPLLKKVKPDLVILDIEVHEYIIQAYNFSTKIILLSQWFSVWTNTKLPSMQSELSLADESLSSRVRNFFHFIILRYKRERRAILASLISGGLSRREILIGMAKKWNFPIAYIGINLWPGQYVYNKLPVLSMTLEALEFPHRKRPNLHYIGPMVDKNRNDTKGITKNEYTIEEVFQLADNKSLKTIYCSVSTMQVGDKSFIEKVIQAVSEMPEWLLIISIGKIEGNFNLTNNVFTFKKVPQIRVLSRVDISINHGGIHTINECIVLNVPMLIYSGKSADQNGCASRMKYHKIAYIGDKDIDSKQEIKSKILSLYSDHKIQIKLKQMRDLYQTQIREGYFEKIIEKHLST